MDDPTFLTFPMLIEDPFACVTTVDGLGSHLSPLLYFQQNKNEEIGGKNEQKITYFSLCLHTHTYTHNGGPSLLINFIVLLVAIYVIIVYYVSF